MANRFWVGNSGYWFTTSHWSTSTGGAGGASVPTPSDAVFFDSNSITSSSQTVTFENQSMPGSGTIECLSINLTGLANNPTFNGRLTTGSGLNVYGAVTLVSGVVFDSPPTFNVHASCNFTSAGQTVNTINDDSSSLVSLQDTLTINTLQSANGPLNLNTNSHIMNVNAFGDIPGISSGASTLTLDGSTINLVNSSPSFVSSGNNTISAIGTTINVPSDGTLELDDADGTGFNNTLSGSSGSKCTLAINASATIVAPIASTTFTNVTVTGVTLLAPLSNGNIDGGGNSGINFSAGTIVNLSGTSMGLTPETPIVENIVSIGGVVLSLTDGGATGGTSLNGSLLSLNSEQIFPQAGNLTTVFVNGNVLDLTDGGATGGTSITGNVLNFTQGSLSISSISVIGLFEKSNLNMSIASVNASIISPMKKILSNFVLNNNVIKIIGQSNKSIISMSALPNNLQQIIGNFDRLVCSINANSYTNCSFNLLFKELQLNALISSGIYTCIVVNTELGNNGISQYANFNFDSFGVLDDGTIIGINTTGVYVLDTSLDDNGTSIASEMQLGLTDMDISLKKKVTDCFVGLRSTGPLSASLVSDDTIYTTSDTLPSTNNKIMTQRVKLPLGAKGRYLGTNIKSLGTSRFKIDSVELRAEVLDERVS